MGVEVTLAREGKDQQASVLLSRSRRQRQRAEQTEACLDLVQLSFSFSFFRFVCSVSVDTSSVSNMAFSKEIGGRVLMGGSSTGCSSASSSASSSSSSPSSSSFASSGRGPRHRRSTPMQGRQTRKVVVVRAHKGRLEWLQSAALKGVAPALAGACLSLMAALNEPSLAAETLRFEGSPNPEIFEAQKTLVQSWAIVRDSFVGSSSKDFYNTWETELRSALDRTVSDGDDVEAAYHEIDGMLGTLGDPYTRFVSPRDYFGVKVQNDGELQGVGLLIASEPSSGRLMVISPIDGSPAARAGIQPGDEVVNINGMPTRGKINGDQAAGYLRGRHGTVVNLKIRSSGEKNADEIGSYRGKPANVQWRQVRLVRDNIVLSPT